MEGQKGGENNVAKKARLFSERSSPESSIWVSDSPHFGGSNHYTLH